MCTSTPGHNTATGRRSTTSTNYGKRLRNTKNGSYSSQSSSVYRGNSFDENMAGRRKPHGETVLAVEKTSADTGFLDRAYENASYIEMEENSTERLSGMIIDKPEDTTSKSPGTATRSAETSETT
jgi:hypothetical protein